MSKTVAFSCFLLLTPALAAAQSVSSTTDLLTKQNPDRWILGAGASVSDKGYAGEGTRIRPFPLVIYNGDRFFWDGLSGGFHAVKNDHFRFDLVLSGRFNGFDVDDLGRKELAANGLDARKLDDRDDELDAGVAVAFRGRFGELKLSALSDVTGTSDGYEAALDYAYTMKWGKTRIVPSVGVRWLSSDLANYYYGTLDSEVARGVVPYRPGSVVVPQIGVGFSRPIGKKWHLFGSASYKFLPDELTDSPLMDHDAHGSAGIRIGIGRSF